MSSKFSGIPKTQKPPAVCKAPPEPDAVPRPAFNERFFQGYAQWFDSVGTDRVALTGTLNMVPDPGTNTWIAETQAGTYVVEVEMEWNPTREDFNYTITLLLAGLVVGIFERKNIQARSLDPFDSGLVNFVQIGGNEIIRCRVLA